MAGTDSAIGVTPPASPARLIDNEQHNTPAGVVDRQRVAVPGLETALSFLRASLGKLAAVIDPLTLRLRVAIESAAVTITGVTTVTTVTTCSTVTNVAQVGGVSAALDQYNSSKAAIAGLRSKITVT